MATDFRLLFNRKVFQVDNEGHLVNDDGARLDENNDPSRHETERSSTWTKSQWENNLYIIENWDTGDRETDLKFRARFPKKYDLASRYICRDELSTTGGLTKRIYRRANPDSRKEYEKKERLVVPQLAVFDAIQEIHLKIHPCAKPTLQLLKPKYANITEAFVATFCELCRGCPRNGRKKTRLKEGMMPNTESDVTGFRRRFLIDFIDFRTDPQKDVYGVVMRWLLVLKDHFTGLCWCKCLPRKKHDFVVHELNCIFGLIGYPLHLQIGDHGAGHFMDRELVTGLAIKNKRMETVTGALQNASVVVDREVTNVVTRDVLDIFLSNAEEERKLGKLPNWTKCLGSVMASINMQNRDCVGGSAYSAVFRMDACLAVRQEESSFLADELCLPVGIQEEVHRNPFWEEDSVDGLDVDMVMGAPPPVVQHRGDQKGYPPETAESCEHSPEGSGSNLKNGASVCAVVTEKTPTIANDDEVGGVQQEKYAGREDTPADSAPIRQSVDVASGNGRNTEHCFAELRQTADGRDHDQGVIPVGDSAGMTKQQTSSHEDRRIEVQHNGDTLRTTCRPEQEHNTNEVCTSRGGTKVGKEQAIDDCVVENNANTTAFEKLRRRADGRDDQQVITEGVSAVNTKRQTRSLHDNGRIGVHDGDTLRRTIGRPVLEGRIAPSEVNGSRGGTMVGKEDAIGACILVENDQLGEVVIAREEEDVEPLSSPLSIPNDDQSRIDEPIVSMDMEDNGEGKVQECVSPVEVTGIPVDHTDQRGGVLGMRLSSTDVIRVPTIDTTCGNANLEEDGKEKCKTVQEPPSAKENINACILVENDQLGQVVVAREEEVEPLSSPLSIPDDDQARIEEPIVSIDMEDNGDEKVQECVDPVEGTGIPLDHHADQRGGVLGMGMSSTDVIRVPGINTTCGNANLEEDGKEKCKTVQEPPSAMENIDDGKTACQKRALTKRNQMGSMKKLRSRSRKSVACQCKKDCIPGRCGCTKASAACGIGCSCKGNCNNPSNI